MDDIYHLKKIDLPKSIRKTYNTYLSIAKQVLKEELGGLSISYDNDTAWMTTWVKGLIATYTIVGKQHNGELRGDLQELWLSDNVFDDTKDADEAGRKLAKLIYDRFHMWDEPLAAY